MAEIDKAMIFRKICVLTILLISTMAYGEVKHPLSSFVDEAMRDIESITGMSTKKSMPDIVISESIDPDTRASKCGPLCKIYAPNIYLSKDNKIWLREHSRVDQLIHELVHFYQSSDNDDAYTGTSDELEIEAIRVQNMFYRNGDETF